MSLIVECIRQKKCGVASRQPVQTLVRGYREKCRGGTRGASQDTGLEGLRKL